MKIYIILFSCLCNCLAITVHYETSLNKNAHDNQNTLKDIRLVGLNQSESLKKLTVSVVLTTKEATENKSVQRARGDVKFNRENIRLKPREDKKKTVIERMGRIRQSVPFDQHHQHYMQKMANQLFMAHKHASLLSDYQKFILNQDPNIKNFLFARPVPEKNPKSFSRPKQAGRAVLDVPNSKYEPVAAVVKPQKATIGTPIVQTAAQKIPQSQNDYSSQATHIKYVTLAPQTLTHFLKAQEPTQKITLVPYHDPQPYTYTNLAVTRKPQLEKTEIPTSLPHGLGSFDTLQYYKDEDGNEDSFHNDDTKYEFMYKVKDHKENTNFGHKESRSDKMTYGYYYVQLPDGRLETVKYWADKTGYHAKVDYEGQAKHPVHTEHKLHSHNFLHP